MLARIPTLREHMYQNCKASRATFSFDSEGDITEGK